MITADRLMQLASKADHTADNYASLVNDHLVTYTNTERYSLIERTAFYRGQASGFRQAAYYATLAAYKEANRERS